MKPGDGRFETVTVKLYYRARDAGHLERIINEGFNAMDNVTAKLPWKSSQTNEPFVNQPGVLASSELDPTSDFSVEIELQTNAVYLRRHELISHVRGVRYYTLIVDLREARRRAISGGEIAQARKGDMEKWNHTPLVWFGKDP